MTENPRVAIVDDEPVILAALQRLLAVSDIDAEVFNSAEEFLARPATHDLTCLIVDINLPGISGIELGRRLAAAQIDAAAHFHDRNGYRGEPARCPLGGMLCVLEEAQFRRGIARRDREHRATAAIDACGHWAAG